VYAKAKYSWDIGGVFGQRIWNEVAECHEKQVRKGCTKGGTVYPSTGSRVPVAAGPDGRRMIDTLTFGTKDFDCISADFILKANR
jgi:hypothetical protein